MYAEYIVKEAGWDDIKQSAYQNLQPGAAGGGIWDWIRSLILKFQNTGLIKSITNRVAKGKLERQLFSDPEFYKRFRNKDTVWGKMILHNQLLPKKYRTLYKQHKGLIDSIDTSNWGKTKEEGLAAFNRQYANDKNLGDQLYNSAKSIFNTWEEAQPKLT